jgi:hypothetical protein
VRWPLLGLCFAAALAQCGAAAARAQDPQGQEEDELRQVKLSDFTRKRPPAPPAPTSNNKPTGSKPSGGSGDSASWNAAPTYHRVEHPNTVPSRRKPSTPPERAGSRTPKPDANPASKPHPAPTEVKEVGVTLWRLRPANQSDTGPSFQVLQSGKLVVMVPERISGTTPVALGDRVRLSIESPRDGYLYVIDREQYGDGTIGTPALVFPTTGIRGGDNKVSAGFLVDIPGGSDPQPYFTLENTVPGKPRIVSELITILISPTPLQGVTPSSRPVALSPDQVAKWQDAWEHDVAEVLEMNGGAGRTWTEHEKSAGEMTRGLTQADPTPQTVYRVPGGPNEPLMVTVQMLYGQPAAASGGATKQP